VKGKKLFSELNAFVSGDLDRGLFIVSGKLRNGLDRKLAEEAIHEELDLLKRESVSKYEMEKVKNKVEANLIFSRMSVLNKAMHLGYYELLGDAGRWNREADKYGKVTSENIMETARQLFKEEKTNTLYYQARK
jgi:hypothetical protein